MSVVHFLNVLEGDCNIIQHDSGRISVIDVSNASNEDETSAERATRTSAQRQTMFSRTQVPQGKTDYRQKLQPDNPIEYLRNRIITEEIFRFIITHPDMDHLDGLRDLFASFKIACFWDTDNKKEILDFNGGGYNKEDWDFYLKLRDGKYRPDVRRTFYSGNSWNYFQQDYIQILGPTSELLQNSIEKDDYNDSSYVLLYTPPKGNGGVWKILLAGDSHDDSWSHILSNYKDMISNVDVLLAPHHGRDSNRNYDFLKIVNPTVTLFGNASSEHLAYDKYPEVRITNNQAGYVIMDISENEINLLVKNKEFANDFRNDPKRNWGDAPYRDKFKAYNIGKINP
jgi:beta-lactamase superfamily II metal-dependent hydrolase